VFRKKVLSKPVDKPVVVNQRHLIDKILARYPTKFTVFRQLIQNSEDAQSSKVEIKFETTNPKTDRNTLKDKTKRIVFRNNGITFKLQDWDRIRQIAVGNFDEQKIGAFGVGFYSVFSVCEEPFIISDGQGMAFYWRDEQLFTRQGEIDEIDNRVWTIFAMDLRELTEFPSVEEFTQFLASLLEFETRKLISITSGAETFSQKKMFQLTSINVEEIKLDALVLKNGSNGSLITDHKPEDSSIFFKIFSGNLDVLVDEKFSKEMRRITKKNLPSVKAIQMIFTGSEVIIPPIFKKLFPYPKPGRIYIGFPTQQTTGYCSHFAARVISTVDHESIDLVDKTLAVYNSEILRLAGVLCRILYEDEMNQIKKRYEEVNDENIKHIHEQLEKRFAYTLTYFTFEPSTPDALVSEIIESQFFGYTEQKPLFLLTRSVLQMTEVRMPNSEMEGFIKKIPVVPKIVFEQCDSFFRKAKNKYMKELSFQDVLIELKI
ncbi:9360_t:CDS:2, partial [Funneliformis caledonium]